jgi:L-arabinokinase
MGVSSSAALEIATLRAISAYAQHSKAIADGAIDIVKNLGFIGTELAHFGQLAENRIVGAPCGLMDQLSIAYGLPHHLLPILCRPDTLYDNIPLPEGIAIVGWPSGIKHSVAESPYLIARTASFMGKKIMETLTHREVRFSTEFSPSEIRGPVKNLLDSTKNHKPATHHHSIVGPFPSCFSHLPVSMLGADYIKLYGKVDDSLSIIKPDLYYPVQAAFNFPVNENYRAQLMISLLSNLASSTLSSSTDATKGTNAFTREPILSQMGELLYQSHRDYSAMGLGCSETDKMIEILQTLRHKGVYGGRSSGGGSGK